MLNHNPSNRSLIIQSIIIYASLISFLLLIPVGAAYAERCTSDEAMLVANNWLKYFVFNKEKWAESEMPDVDRYEEIIYNGELVGYYLDIMPDGYIVVPLLKELPPVKLFSTSGRLDLNEMQGLSAMIKEVLWDRLNLYRNFYGSLDALQSSTGPVLLGREHRQNWDLFLLDKNSFEAELNSGKLKTFRGGYILLKSSWDQDDPYNQDCPLDGGTRCPVGCVATAAAQIMYYWKYPVYGVGSHSYSWNGQTLSADFSDTYDWSNMVDSCDAGCTQVQEDALAELCYEVGVAFEMDYGESSSSAYTSDAETVFPKYFGYRDDIAVIERKDFTAATWFDSVKSEISLARPIQYRIATGASSGHSIVCDGWMENAQDMYHINYGWAGTNTGWYAVDNIEGTYLPINEEYMVIHIQPHSTPYIQPNIPSSSIWGMVSIILLILMTSVLFIVRQKRSVTR